MIEIAERLFKVARFRLQISRVYLQALLLLVLLPYFLFNIGFIYEVTSDFPSSVSLSLERMKNSDDERVTINLGANYTRTIDVFGAAWLSQMVTDKSKIYADETSGSYILPSYAAVFPVHNLGTDEIEEHSYIYLNYVNVVRGIIKVWNPRIIPYTEAISIHRTTEFADILRNKIYTNGGSEIYYYR